MNPKALLIGLLLAAAPATSHAETPADANGDAADWALKRAAQAFTSDNKVFGEVHFPVIATNPNAGLTYGVLPVWLVHNSSHEIVQIFAPMLTYNRTYGVSFDGSYYYYPSGHEKLRAVLAKSERSNERAAVQYDNRALADSRATLLIVANFEADGGAQFYGIGPASPKGNEASERLLEDLVKGEMGIRFWESFIAAAGWQFRRTEVQNGPFSAPAPVPLDLRTTTSYSIPRVSLSRDTRDLPFTPSSGTLSEVFAEYSAAALGGSASYMHYGGQWRCYAPTTGSLVTVLHAQAEWSGGGNVPFTALSQLGGPNTLRGFPEGRFQDRGSAFANLEERWLVHSVDLVHSVTEFQFAPFLDAGTVFPTPGQAQVRRVEGVVGVAMRAVVKPAVVGKVEVGVGREGPAVFVGIDYPF